MVKERVTTAVPKPTKLQVFEMKRERLLVGISIFWNNIFIYIYIWNKWYIITKSSFSWLEAPFMQSAQRSKMPFLFLLLFSNFYPLPLSTQCPLSTLRYFCSISSQDVRAWVIKWPLKPESAFCHPSYNGEEVFSTLGLIIWAKIQSCHITTV